MSAALIAAIALTFGASIAVAVAPERHAPLIERQPLALFPSVVENWRRVSTETLEPRIEKALKAEDYLAATYVADGVQAPVDLFVAWYDDQTTGGIHSPEVCLPGGGWEMAQIERVDLSDELGVEEAFMVNRAVIQRGENRLLVYYWFEQYGGRTASDIVAKAALIKYGLLYNRTDGALVRLITPIQPGESQAVAEQRLLSMTKPAMHQLSRFVPTRAASRL
jgi:EpsI family protein